MGFQQTVSLSMGFGVQGEEVYDGPRRVKPWQIISTPQPNVIGATAYTVVSPETDTSAGIAMAGGVTEFAGILINPKVYASFGASSGSLDPTLTLSNDTIAELMTMGTPLVKLTTAANVGDLVVYDTTTGALSSVVSSFAATASFATNVMTVTGTPGGVIGIGSQVSGTGIPPGTIVTSLGTGTGGAGTYNLSTSPGTVASATVSIGAGTNAGTGKKFVPHAKVILRASAANGLAIIELTN